MSEESTSQYISYRPTANSWWIAYYEGMQVVLYHGPFKTAMDAETFLKSVEVSDD